MSGYTKPATGRLEQDLLDRMLQLEVDHDPDGWPAVQMRDISALCAEVQRRFGIQSELQEVRRERDELREKLQALRERGFVRAPAGCGYPYCGGNAPECISCGQRRA